MLRPLAALVLIWGCGACLPASADQPSFTMYYHWEGGLSAYRFVTVEIASDGRASCEIAHPTYARQTVRSDLDLTPQEIAYFEPLFRQVLALDRRAIEVMATDVGLTTWRMTEDGRTAELSYGYTHNPWVTDLQQAMWRFVARETALLKLAQDDPKARYSASHDVLSDLSQGRIFRPEDLRAPLLEAAREWPTPQLSFDHSRDTIKNLFQALVYCESPEQWVGDVTELYASQTHESRAIMLRAIAESTLLYELEGDRGRMLVPLMIEGLTEMLDDPALPDDGNVGRAVLHLTNALGSLRDARALEVLSSERFWESQDDRTVMTGAANALTLIGLPGVRALVEKTSSECFLVRLTAQAQLAHSAQNYGFPSIILPRGANPTLRQVTEVREFLVERGLGPDGIDAFDIADAAANALHQSYPGWRYIMSSEFCGPALHGLHEWEYDLRERGPQRCRLDYDGNGLEDIALLIRKDDELRLVVLRQTSEGPWTTDELASFSHDNAYDDLYGGIDIFIAPAPPQRIALRLSAVPMQTAAFDTTGIALHHGKEPASTVFYWTGDGPDTATP